MTSPSPQRVPIPAGTLVTLHPSVRFYGTDLVAGGAPWRLLRLPGPSHAVVERWRGGDVVRPGEENLARTLVSQGLLDTRIPLVGDVDDVDVVVPVRDDVAALAHLLDELDGLRVTVVDDGSADAVAVESLVNTHGAALLRRDASEGPASARNAGAGATTRAFIAFVDADVVLGDARDLLRALRSAFADPSVGAVAPRVRGVTGASARERFEHGFGPLDLGARGGLVHPGGAVPFVPSACLLVRREAFGTGFDASLQTGEDVDLVWRLIDDGWLVRYLADVAVTHPARATWPAWWRQRVAYGRSSGELARRHGARVAPLRADPWTIVAWAGLLARAPWLSARSVLAVRTALARRLEGSTADAESVAGALVARSMLGAGGPLARALVRTYGPLILVVALHPSLRRRALALWALGTAYRFRGSRPRVADVVLGVADDVAYALGVAAGAWRARSLTSLTPAVTASTLGWRDLLGARRR